MAAGRKPKLTKEFTEDFCRALSMGLSNKAACDYTGIVEATLYEYLKKAEIDERLGKKTIYTEFLKSYKKAKAGFRLYHLAKIRQASESGSWQASAWTLERCCPEEYGRQVKSDEDSNGILNELMLALKANREIKEK